MGPVRDKGGYSFAALMKPSPADQQVVDGRGPDDWFRRHRQVCGMQDERTRLRATQTTVEGDQFLECATLLEIGVIEAVDEDVGGVCEAIRALEVSRSVGRERRERILSLDPIRAQKMTATRTEHYGSVLTKMHHHEADVRVPTEGLDQLGVATVDLLRR